MELIYPFVLYIGLPILVILSLMKFKRKEDVYKRGTKIANTKYAEKIPLFKEIMKKYRVMVTAIKAVSIISIIVALIMISRPAKVESSKSSKYNRDIFLCMDTSTSVDELNLKLVDNFRDTVKNLKGERIGITIFNTSSVVLVPLTDDYNYVLNTLDELEKAIKYSINPGEVKSLDEASYLSTYIRSGTLIGNEVRGSSLIGDGLASCVYSFPNLKEDKDRTRIIIFSTDNDLAGNPIVTLEEASNICRDEKVTVFGIAPTLGDESKKSKMKQAVENTGGTFFDEASGSTVKEIVANIEKKGKSLLEVNEETRKIDKPLVPFILLIISIAILFILNKKVKV